MKYNRAFKIVVLILLLLLGHDSYATHNRAGEISFEQIGPLTIRLTLTTYTKTSSIAADRDSIEIFWGDGTSQFMVRENGWGDPQPNDIKINYYRAVHIYPARASYTISMYDPNRVGGILNLNYPDSESVPFYLETSFTFLNTQFQGENNSAVLLQAPIDFGCVGQVFTHNPNAYDVDGDSLHYSLIIPLQGHNSSVPDYYYPDQIEAGVNNKLSIDTETGNLTWNTPQIAGEYNIAIRIDEYRQGVLINSMIRDMQIFIVDDCQNQPPILELEKEICVFAGDTVQLKISVNDPDSGQKVRLEASGAPFISTSNKAEIEGGNIFNEIGFDAYFSWITSCDDISDQSYQIVFKAMDNGFSDTSGLATLKTYKVKVIGPAPDSLKIEPAQDHFKIFWEYPYLCSFTTEDYFLGFSIWRSKQANFLELDSCSYGLDENLYEKISFQHNINDGIQYFYDDFEFIPGENYCYRVMAEFAHKSFDGFPYNHVSGQPGNEVCLTIPLNIPYLTKASVDSTHNLTGMNALSWKMTELDKFDTLSFPPPYEIEILESTNGIDYSIIGNPIQFESLSTEINGNYVHANLNTRDLQYSYLLDFYYGENRSLLGSSPDAATPFLTHEENDQSISLYFDTNVPWLNHAYEIYRNDFSDPQFKLIGSTPYNNWTDTNVENWFEYCYIVKTIGSYTFNPSDTLINYSQKLCAIPKDVTPPCSPVLEAISKCDTMDIYTPEQSLYNEISWYFNDPACYDIMDLDHYKIFYATDQISDFTHIATIPHDEPLNFVHVGDLGLNACYYVTAVDYNGNESDRSNIVCFENCPVYELPNVFTPDNDGVNDTYVPRFKRHVYSIDMHIYNQWGQLVFKTNDPDINWDGTNLSGKYLADGVYHYICDVFEDTFASKEQNTKQLTGFIHLIRGN